MKKNYGIVLAAIFIGLLVTGVSVGDAEARQQFSPGEECALEISSFSKMDQGSFFDPETQRCYIRYFYNSNNSTKGNYFGKQNSCYPDFNVRQAVWTNNIFDIKSKTNLPWFWQELGCMGGPSNQSDNVIKDPLRGNHDTGAGGSFGYEAQTCAGACRIDQHALTGKAKNALGALDGKVVGKTYVQIKDKNGTLDYGNFTLCLQAMGAKNPAFFRYGGGNTWSYMGGYLKGAQFCMVGTMSGNYVLVDMGN